MRRLSEGMLEAGWLATALLLPLFIDKSGAQVFDPAKAGVLRAIALAMLWAWAIKALLAPVAQPASTSLRLRARFAALSRVPLALPAAAVLLSTLLATALSISPAQSFWGQRERAEGAFTLLAELGIFAATAANLRERRQLERLLTALILPSLPIAAYAIFQRLGFEPLHVTVRETDVARATSLLGQPVFLAAYLGMIMPFTALRFVAASQASEAPRVQRVLRAACYAALFALSGVAALFSESRGALLGIAMGGATALLAVAAQRGLRRAVLALAAVGALAVALVVSRAPSTGGSAGDAESARIARRAAATFEVRGSGGMFRTVQWQLAERVLRNRKPLEFADGSRDRRAGLRQLVGYGPEMQYAISPPFYDAILPQMSGYFLADRYHNDLWETVITRGLLGLAASLCLQAALFFALFRWLGVLGSSRRRPLFWAAYAGGGVVGALGWSAVQGLPFAFLGLQTGCALGLLVFLAGDALFCSRADPRASTRGRPAEALVVHEPVTLRGLPIAVAAALVAHQIEVSFSFTVVVTGALFWLLCALVVAHGRFERDGEPAPEPQAASAGAEPRRRQAPVLETPDERGLRDSIADGALLALVLMALGFAFLGRSSAPTRAGAVLWEGLTALSQPPGGSWPVVGVLALGALLIGALILWLESSADDTAPGPARPGWSLTIASVGSGLFWLWLANVFARLGRPAGNPALSVALNLDVRETAITGCYVFGLLLMLVLARASARAESVPASAAQVGRAPWRLALAPLLALGAGWLVLLGSLRPAWAEAAVAVGDALRNQNRAELAEQAYLRATALVPGETAYRALLAKAYAKHARSEPARAEAWLEQADKTMLQAISVNPVAGENATNLAVIRGNWAQRASAARRDELRATVPGLYAQALRLNPQDPSLWRLWAGVQMSLLREPAAALASARRMLELEPNNGAAYALVADCRAALARTQSGEPRRLGLLDAAASYAKASELTPKPAALRVQEGKAYFDAGQPREAAASFRAALALLPTRSNARPSLQTLLRQAEAAVSMATAPNVE